MSIAYHSPGSLNQKTCSCQAFPSPLRRIVTDAYFGVCLQNVFISIPMTSFSSSFSFNSQVPSVTTLSQNFLYTVTYLHCHLSMKCSHPSHYFFVLCTYFLSSSRPIFTSHITHPSLFSSVDYKFLEDRDQSYLSCIFSIQ